MGVVLNIYKEKYWTSFDVVAKVRGMLSALNIDGSHKHKVGHAGTLDPLAEGVLIVLTDEDTKKQTEFMALHKEYVCEIAFGLTSPTYDLEGELTDFEVPEDLDLSSQLNNLLKNYIGKINQTVPIYSAVKVNGKRLYNIARKGKEVSTMDLPSKEVEIYSIDVLRTFHTKIKESTYPCAELRVLCSSGTYIRSIANDLGKDLMVGGVLTGLIRTKIGDFKIDDSIKIPQLVEILKG